MYTGRYPHAPTRRKSRFGAVLFAGVFILLLLLLLIAATAQSGGVYLVLYDDGMVLLGKPEHLDDVRLSNLRPAGGKASPDPAVSPPLNLTNSPATSFAPLPEDGAKLTAAEVYHKTSASVTGILSESRYGYATGSGIIMTTDGYVITNHHVVEGAEVVTVILSDGTEYDAAIIGSDRITDLAVLKIKASGLQAAEFGNSEALIWGDPVVAIGNPLGMDLQNTITDGIISGINRDITLEDVSGDITMNVLQTNCAVNAGNSGGPLINQYGQVIGIISSKIISSEGSGVEGLGFAIPINSAQPVLNELAQYGYVRGRPALGVTVNTGQNIDRSTAQFYGIPTGVLISEVNPKSDCYAKGVRSGDIVTHVNGEAVSTLADVNVIKAPLNVGDTLTLTLYRKGETFDVTVALMEAGEMN